MDTEFERVRDFLVLHYHATERADTPFWDHCRTMRIPDSLQYNIALFRERGAVVNRRDAFFTEPSWLAVMLGQHILPRRVDPLTDSFPAEDIQRNFESLRAGIRAKAEDMPAHHAFIERYCAGSPSAGHRNVGGQNWGGCRAVPDDHLRSIAIVGGGVAAWMSAAVLARMLHGRVAIHVVDTGAAMLEAEAATLPNLNVLHAILRLDEPDLMRRTGATFRLGGAFADWSRTGHSYFHPLGDIGANLQSIAFRHHWLKLREAGDTSALTDFALCAMAARAGKFAKPSSDKGSVLSTLDYAHHFDTVLYAAYLRMYAEQGGVQRSAARVADVILRADGSVEAVALENGERVEADLFIDASGADALLIGGALKTEFEDWQAWLPCDRVIAAPVEGKTEPLPYSLSTAREAGWQWSVPLQNRAGAGYVYCSRYMSDDAARAAFLASTKPLAEPRVMSFASGRRASFWNKNVVAIGAAGCVLEPLEGANIQLIQSGILRLMALLPDRQIADSERAEYNRLMVDESERIRDFLILHYKATERSDTPFWDYCRSMTVPEPLDYKIRLFKSRGRVVLYDEETFGEQDWVSVFIGQDVIPQRYDPLIDTLDIEQIRAQLHKMKGVIRHGAESLPQHRVYLEKFLAQRPAGAR